MEGVRKKMGGARGRDGRGGNGRRMKRIWEGMGGRGEEEKDKGKRRYGAKE